MKTINRILNISMMSTLILVFIASCAKEPLMNDNTEIDTTLATQKSATRGGGCLGNLTMNANSCTFASGEDHISNTGENVVTLLNSCHTEQLAPGCQWFFQNRTSESIISYSEFSNPCITSGTLNSHLAQMVQDANDFRPNASYLITSYELYSVSYSTGGGWVVKVRVNYRKRICKYKKERK